MIKVGLTLKFVKSGTTSSVLIAAIGINFDVDVTRPSVLAPYPFLKPFPARFVFNGKCFVLDLEIYFENDAT